MLEGFETAEFVHQTFCEGFETGQFDQFVSPADSSRHCPVASHEIWTIHVLE